jgi:hypothetical protein
MKAKPFPFLAVIVTVMVFVSCDSKPKQARLDTIIKDLAADSYSLSFDKTYPDYGITQTSYGAESMLAYAEPQDVICPEPWRKRFPGLKVPVYVIPKLVLPTCPTMIPPDIGIKLSDLLAKADPAIFTGLKQIKVDGVNVLLANDKFTAQYANLKTDMMDDSVLNNLDANKYLLLMESGNMYAGFTRGFYGNANLNDLSGITKSEPATAAKAKVPFPFKKFFRPIYIGCFDPEILTSLKDKLVLINPQVYKALQINELPEGGRIATLSMQ